MNYDETLNYIHSITWRGSRLGLERTQELLAALGNPEKGLRFVHIAGTNGKGSTAAMTASVLKESGYKTGLYTSPYIIRFNERMQINGEHIADDELARITEEVRPYADAMEDYPTEFELITVVAFLYFARNNCDIVVMEVGLGGTLDSTNVIDTPKVAVITAIGLDHMAELGETITEIAGAKAGIIKSGGSVVNYGNSAEANAVFEQICKEKGATIYNPDFAKVRELECSLSGQRFEYGEYKDLTIPLVGSYQLKNVAVVLTVLDLLKSKGYNITVESVREGFKNVVWPGRFEIVSKEPVFIVDGGHNPQGVSGTIDSLKKYFPGKKVYFLVGVMADKDVSTMLDEIKPLAKRCVAVKPDNPRALSADKLAKSLGGMGIEAEACVTVPQGVSKILAYANKDDVICAIGSLYMSAEIRGYMENNVH